MASLFDLFSSSPGKKAANQAYAATTGGLTQGLTDATNYTNLARNDINAGKNQALGFLNAGTNKALNLYAPLAEGANAGYNAYGDAAGVNGQEGYDRATSSFHTSPGYEFQMNQGLDALDRRANSRGLLSSGNNTIDTLKYSQGLADQEWGDYISRLAPYLDLAPNIANSQSDLYTNLASNEANVATSAASNLASLYDRLGGRAYDTGVAKGTAGSQLAADKFAAEQSANANQFGLFSNLLNAGLGFI